MTIRDIAIAFGYELDEKSETKVNQSIEKTKQKATQGMKQAGRSAVQGANQIKGYFNKILAVVGLSLSLKSVYNLMKNYSEDAKAFGIELDNLKQKTGELLANADKELGVMRTLTKVVKDLYARFENGLKKAVSGIKEMTKRLGGTTNAIKLVAASAAALWVVMNFDKITRALQGINNLLRGINLKSLAIMAALLLVFLLVEDFVAFMKGKGSLFGDFLDAEGIDADGFRENIKEILGKVKELGGPLKELGKTLLNSLLTSAEKLMPTVKKFVEKVLPKLIELAGIILGIIVDLGGDTLSLIIELVADLIESGVELADTLLPFLVELGQTLADFITDNKDDIVSLLQGLLGLMPKVTALLSVILSLLLDLGEDALDGILTIIEGLISFLVDNQDTILTVITKVIDGATDLFNRIDEWIKNEDVKEFLTILIPLLLAAFKGFTTGWKIGEKLASIISVVSAAFKGLNIKTVLIIAGIILLIAAIAWLIKNWDKVKETAQKVWDKIKDIWGKVADWFRENIIDPIATKFDELKEKISTKLSEAKETFETIVGSIAEFFQDPVGKIREGLQSIKDWFGKVIDKVSELADKYFPGLKGAIDTIKSKWDELKQKLQPVVDVLEKVVGFFRDIVNMAKEGIGNTFSKIGGWFSGLGGKGNGGMEMNATGTESSGDAFLAGEEGPEFIVGQRGKKVYNALATARIMNSLMALSRIPKAKTANTVNNSSSKSIVQNIEFHQQFNGDRAGQRQSATAMDRAAKDVTGELARALAYTK